MSGKTQGLRAISFRRALLIARRDYMGYIKTWGFWISFFLPFIFGVLGFFIAAMDFDFSPPRYEAILDETGSHKAAIIARENAKYVDIVDAALQGLGKKFIAEAQVETLRATLKREGVEGVEAELIQLYPALENHLKLPEPKTIFVDPPAETLDGIKPYLLGQKKLNVNGETVPLGGVMVIRDTTPPTSEYWSKNINAYGLRNSVRNYFRDQAEDAYLKEAGLSKAALRQARRSVAEIETYNPGKAAETGDQSAQVVNDMDRIPYLIAGIMAAILWLTVFSGSYMLLTSMLEEKLNKLLEMMLATTRFSEIMLGKLIGVGALTLTAMLPYMVIGVAAVILGIAFGGPEVSALLGEAFSAKMIIFFLIFLVLGYLFYGSLFIAMGAMSNSMQDAQTVTTPIVLILTFCVMIVPFGIENPDSPLLTFASWFPLSAPFASIVRLPADPPLWELCLSAAFLAFLSIGTIWLASRVFRYGVLSGAGMKGAVQWMKRVVFRRKV